MALPIGTQMSGRRLLSLLQQRLRMTQTWRQDNNFRSNCQCARAPAQPGNQGRRSGGVRGLAPAVALQAFAIPGIFSWSSSKDEEVKPVKEHYLLHSLFVQCKGVPEKVDDPDKALIDEADRLYAASEVKPLYELLVKHKDSKNPEVLWRLARATTDLGKHAILEDVKHDCFVEAFKYIEKALEVGEDNFGVHKWYAILLDYTSEIEGTKKRISNAVKVKEHFERALELNPNDPTTIHSLGYWCYVFADLKWYQRKVASAFYATPPTSTFQEALAYFQNAEQMEPNFYSANLLMLGKTYMKLQDPVLAYTYLKKCVDFPVKTPDDKKSQLEAIKLLKSMGVKEDGNKP